MKKTRDVQEEQNLRAETFVKIPAKYRGRSLCLESACEQLDPFLRERDSIRFRLEEEDIRLKRFGVSG